MVETGQMDFRCPVNTCRVSVVCLLALLQRLDLPKLFPATIQRRLTNGVTTTLIWTACRDKQPCKQSSPEIRLLLLNVRMLVALCFAYV